MEKVQEYRLRNPVRATKLQSPGKVVTRKGVEHARVGDYLVFGERGVTLVPGKEFEAKYVVISVQEKVEMTYSPLGKPVNEVLEFMRKHPGEVERIKEIEREKGKNRKQILEF